MDKLLNKIKYFFKINKKSFYIMAIITLVGISVGSIFIYRLDDTNKTYLIEKIDSYLNNINSNNLNYLNTLKNNIFCNIFYVVLIWILGISLIGLICNIIIYLFKSFVIGFSISTFILKFKTKGLIYSILYIFPVHLINYIVYTILTIYSIRISKTIIYLVLNKKEISFKELMNKYLYMLLIFVLIVVFTAFLETYFIPFCFHQLSNILK